MFYVLKCLLSIKNYWFFEMMMFIEVSICLVYQGNFGPRGPMDGRPFMGSGPHDNNAVGPDFGMLHSPSYLYIYFFS